ncbi:unnamed protein product, partial [Amoebophrya sp. A120]
VLDDRTARGAKAVLSGLGHSVGPWRFFVYCRNLFTEGAPDDYRQGAQIGAGADSDRGAVGGRARWPRTSAPPSLSALNFRRLRYSARKLARRAGK